MKNHFEILALLLFTFIVFYLIIAIAGDPIIDGIGFFLDAGAPLIIFCLNALYLGSYIFLVGLLISFGFEVRTRIVEWSQEREVKQIKQIPSNQEIEMNLQETLEWYLLETRRQIGIKNQKQIFG